MGFPIDLRAVITPLAVQTIKVYDFSRTIQHLSRNHWLISWKILLITYIQTKRRKNMDKQET